MEAVTVKQNEFAGWVSANIWPDYLKMGEDESGERPRTIAFSPCTYEIAMKHIEKRNLNVKHGEDGHRVDDKRLMTMDVVFDDNIADDDWEIRW